MSTLSEGGGVGVGEVVLTGGGGGGVLAVTRVLAALSY